jgi:hypothetical protein
MGDYLAIIHHHRDLDREKRLAKRVMSAGGMDAHTNGKIWFQL